MTASGMLLPDLLRRLEATTRPDRALDAAIAETLGTLTRPYTASLDAAVGAVPAGLFWSLSVGLGNQAKAHAMVDLERHGTAQLTAMMPGAALIGAALVARAKLSELGIPHAGR